MVLVLLCWVCVLCFVGGRTEMFEVLSFGFTAKVRGLG